MMLTAKVDCDIRLKRGADPGGRGGGEGAELIQGAKRSRKCGANH
jgi:hypothetical protein